jgi:hypothetical protein
MDDEPYFTVESYEPEDHPATVHVKFIGKTKVTAIVLL